MPPIPRGLATGWLIMGEIGKSATSPDMKERKRQWVENAQRFLEEQGSRGDDIFPRAWVSTIRGDKYLCMSEPLALSIIDPQSIGVEDSERTKYTQQYYSALIAHEYVHVQGNLKLTDPYNDARGGRIGGLLTELQAEVFSNGHPMFAYADEHNLANNIAYRSKVFLLDVMKSHDRGGSADKMAFYLDLVNRLGWFRLLCSRSLVQMMVLCFSQRRLPEIWLHYWAKIG